MAMTSPSLTSLPSLTPSLRIVPPMRARAGTTVRLSTWPNTAFVSAMTVGVTTNSAAAAGKGAAASSAAQINRLGFGMCRFSE